MDAATSSQSRQVENRGDTYYRDRPDVGPPEVATYSRQESKSTAANTLPEAKAMPSGSTSKPKAESVDPPNKSW